MLQEAVLRNLSPAHLERDDGAHGMKREQTSPHK